MVRQNRDRTGGRVSQGQENRYSSKGGRPAGADSACANLHRRTTRGATMRQVLIYPGEDGFWVAECPSLPGCISQGASREEAIENVREAIEAYTLSLEEDGLTVPVDSLEALLVAV